MTRKHGRPDANQGQIVQQCRDLGYSVAVTSDLGNGFPDIMVGTAGFNLMFEIKDPSQPPSKRRLTPNEVDFHAGWRGQIDVVETIDDIVRVVAHKLKEQLNGKV